MWIGELVRGLGSLELLLRVNNRVRHLKQLLGATVASWIESSPGFLNLQEKQLFDDDRTILIGSFESWSPPLRCIRR
jgi:hypothetical protein